MPVHAPLLMAGSGPLRCGREVRPLGRPQATRSGGVPRRKGTSSLGAIGRVSGRSQPSPAPSPLQPGAWPAALAPAAGLPVLSSPGRRAPPGPPPPAGGGRGRAKVPPSRSPPPEPPPAARPPGLLGLRPARGVERGTRGCGDRAAGTGGKCGGLRYGSCGCQSERPCPLGDTPPLSLLREAGLSATRCWTAGRVAPPPVPPSVSASPKLSHPVPIPLPPSRCHLLPRLLQGQLVPLSVRVTTPSPRLHPLFQLLLGV